MAVVIRMKRAGAKKRPFFRVVVADSRSPRDGRYIEQLGYYDPLTDPATFRVDEVRFTHWVLRGARPSTSVEVMMAKHAPAALRAAPAPETAAAEGVGADEPPAVPEKVAAKKAAKKKAAKKKTATKKAAKKKVASKTKGTEKKAKTRAKAKARKTAGVAKKGARKKAKKS